jgi:dTDP-4-dehydrorhamnose reductase
VVRTSWVYATGGTNFMCTIARLAHVRPELRIVADQIGSPTSAGAIADALSTIVVRGACHLSSRFAESGGLVHLACGGETSWHGFAVAIVEGLKRRGIGLRVERVIPVATEEYSRPARRPRNSRLDQTRLSEVFGIALPHWEEALARELDVYVCESY